MTQDTGPKTQDRQVCARRCLMRLRTTVQSHHGDVDRDEQVPLYVLGTLTQGRYRQVPLYVPGLRTQDSGLSTQNSGFRTQD